MFIILEYFFCKAHDISIATDSKQKINFKNDAHFTDFPYLAPQCAGSAAKQALEAVL
jgi:hypothetical protein